VLIKNSGWLSITKNDGAKIELKLEYSAGALVVHVTDRIGETIRSQGSAAYRVYDGLLELDEASGNITATDTIIFVEDAVISLVMEDMIPGEDFSIRARIAMPDVITETEIGFAFGPEEEEVFEQ